MPKKRPPPHKCEHKDCRAYAKIGKRFCRRHESHETQLGVNGSNIKTGRYSSALPQNLRPSYELSARDPELLQLRDEISALDARAIELQQRLGSGESGSAWKAVAEAIAQLDSQIMSKDGKAVLTTLDSLKELAEKGCGDSGTWEEIQKIFRLRKELCEAESKRLLALKQFLSIERCLLLIQNIVEVIHAEVPDIESRERIVVRLDQLMSYKPNSNRAQIDRAEQLERAFQIQAEESDLF